MQSLNQWGMSSMRGIFNAHSVTPKLGQFYFERVVLQKKKSNKRKIKSEIKEKKETTTLGTLFSIGAFVMSKDQFELWIHSP